MTYFIDPTVSEQTIEQLVARLVAEQDRVCARALGKGKACRNPAAAGADDIDEIAFVRLARQLLRRRDEPERRALELQLGDQPPDQALTPDAFGVVRIFKNQDHTVPLSSSRFRQPVFSSILYKITLKK